MPPFDPSNLNLGGKAQDFPTNIDLWKWYQDIIGDTEGDYSDIMGQYQGFDPAQLTAPGQFGFQSISPSSIEASQISPSLIKGSLRDPSSLSAYRQFSQTGGFSPGDIRAIRARGISPIRSVYANAMRDLNRQRALQGGYSPNYTAAVAKMGRGLGEGLSEATTGVEAMLAPLVQQGKLAGLAGLSRGEEAKLSRQLRTQLSNQQAAMEAMRANQATSTQTNLANLNAMMQAMMSNQQAGLSAQGMSEQARAAYNRSLLASSGQGLDAIRGQASLYGTTPGKASTFGDMILRLLGLGQNATQAEIDAVLRLLGMGGQFGGGGQGGISVPGTTGTGSGTGTGGLSGILPRNWQGSNRFGNIVPPNPGPWGLNIYRKPITGSVSRSLPSREQYGSGSFDPMKMIDWNNIKFGISSSPLMVNTLPKRIGAGQSYTPPQGFSSIGSQKIPGATMNYFSKTLMPGTQEYMDYLSKQGR